jgi:hypothetical protein
MKTIKNKIAIFLCLIMSFLFITGGVINREKESGIIIPGVVALAEESAEGDVDSERQENPNEKDPVAIFLAIGFFLVCLFFCVEAIVSFSKKAKKDREKQFSRE